MASRISALTSTSCGIGVSGSTKKISASTASESARRSAGRRRAAALQRRIEAGQARMRCPCAGGDSRNRQEWPMRLAKATMSPSSRHARSAPAGIAAGSRFRRWIGSNISLRPKARRPQFVGRGRGSGMPISGVGAKAFAVAGRPAASGVGLRRGGAAAHGDRRAACRDR